jgi:hypothetical protein
VPLFDFSRNLSIGNESIKDKMDNELADFGDYSQWPIHVEKKKSRVSIVIPKKRILIDHIDLFTTISKLPKIQNKSKQQKKKLTKEKREDKNNIIQKQKQKKIDVKSEVKIEKLNSTKTQIDS